MTVHSNYLCVVKALSKAQHIQHESTHLHENCSLLRYYEPSSGNFFPTFRDNLSVSFPTAKNSKESRLYKYTAYIRNSVGGDKFSVRWRQAVWLMQVAGRMEECKGPHTRKVLPSVLTAQLITAQLYRECVEHSVGLCS